MQESHSCFALRGINLRCPTLNRNSAPEFGAGGWQTMIPSLKGHYRHVSSCGRLISVMRLPLWFVFQEEPRSKSKICANVFCGAGRECAVTEKGEPTCLCIEVGPGVRHGGRWLFRGTRECTSCMQSLRTHTEACCGRRSL